MTQKRKLLVAALAAGWASAATSGQTIVPYLIEGDEAPGTFNPPDLWQNFDGPVISEAGVVLATGDTDAPTTDDDVVFAGMTLVAIENMTDPSFLGPFSSFQEPTTNQEINVGGDVVFIANLRSPAPTTSNEGVYKYEAASGVLSTVIVEGDAAPGLAGRTIVDMEFAGIFDNGQVGFMATLDDLTTGDEVIYRNGVPLYQAGGPIAGFPPQITWDGNFGEVSWNGAGDVFFEGNGGILFVNRGGVEEVVLTDAVPVTVRGGGTDFVDLVLETALAENGDWGVRGNLQNAPSTDDAFIITASGAQFQQGEPIPELPGAVTGNFNGMDLNSFGEVVYLADIAGAADPNVDEGLFLNGQLLVTDGMQVPGQPDGVIFTDIAFEDFAINDAGTIVFRATFTTGIDGLFLITRDASCLCELDGDAAQVNVFDLLAYLDLWFVNDAGADVDGTPGVDVFDLLAFLDCWFPASAGAPCP